MEERHRDADGNPVDREAIAAGVASGAVVGPVDAVVEALAGFIEKTGARRLAIYAEAIADRDATLESIERFAKDVVPQLQARID